MNKKSVRVLLWILLVLAVSLLIALLSTVDSTTIVVDEKYLADTHDPPRYVRSEYQGWYNVWGSLRVDEQYIVWVYGNPDHYITGNGTAYLLGYGSFHHHTPKQKYAFVAAGQRYKIYAFNLSEIGASLPNVVWKIESA